MALVVFILMNNSLLETALTLRYVKGTMAAAEWLEFQGISYQLAIIALVGGRRAAYYGVRIDASWHSKGDRYEHK